jgi:competence protein ComEA
MAVAVLATTAAWAQQPAPTGATGAAKAKAKAKAKVGAEKAEGTIDLNTATTAQLETLPNVGPALAKAIIAGRPYKSVDDLERVKGIGKTRLAAIREHVRVGGTSATAATKSAGSRTTAKSAAAIDLNTASEKDLESLPGIGPVTAKKIIAGRPYKSVDDLAKAGVSAREIEKVRTLVVVHPTLAPGSPKSASAPRRIPATELAGMININTASEKDLASLRGIGPAIAKGIVAARPFKSIDDLEQVKGIGKARLAMIRDRVTVGEASPGTAKSATASTTKKEARPATPRPAPAPTRLEPGETVNINTASAEELDKLFGIGPVKAQAIIDARPYKTIEDIKKAKGVGDKTFEKIKDSIRVE